MGGHDLIEVVVLIAGYFIYDTGDMLRSKTRQSAELIFHHAVVSVKLTWAYMSKVLT